jgi:malate/lactate dehydrogenase
VEAWSIGEHGDLTVPLWDRVAVNGERVALDDAQRGEVVAFVGGWYVRHVALDSRRSSTWTSGLGIARMVRSCLDPDGDELWPASVMLTGEYGVDGVSLSVPVQLRGGVRRIEEWQLSRAERDALHAGARFVREAADGL